MAIRGGSRIPCRRERGPSREAPTYNFVKFSQKPHEIEKILGSGGRGGECRGRPPPWIRHWQCLLVCFPSSAGLKLESGKSGTMSEIQVGDRVQTGTENVHKRINFMFPLESSGQHQLQKVGRTVKISRHEIPMVHLHLFHSLKCMILY